MKNNNNRMTRRRARNGTQKIPRQLSISGRMAVKIISVFHFTANQTSLPFTGRDSTLHPNYSYNNTSIDGSTLLGSIVQSSSTVGLAKNLVVKRVKLTLNYQNLDAVAKEINIIPVPWNNTGSSGLGNDYNVNLKSRVWCKTILVAKAGTYPDIGTLVIDVDVSKVEGINIANLPQYWATNTTRGTQYTNYYLQCWSMDASTAHTLGVVFQAKAEYDCEIVQANTNLNA